MTCNELLSSTLSSFVPTLSQEFAKAPYLAAEPYLPLTNPCSEEISLLFPQTSHQPYLKFVPTQKISTNPLRVGVMFSGGPAPGGHNVILGLLHAIKHFHPESELLGFLNNGAGLLNNETIQITHDFMKSYKYTGGFNCLGTGRTNLIPKEKRQACLKTIQKLQLDSLVIIGGDGSNTTTAVFSEYFKKNKINTCVIGVPKTIDGDLQHPPFLDLTFGFDTATKFYSTIISNISRDALSCKAHYHFIKLMGRSASHITLECALQTHPNIALIGEEIAQKNISLKTIVHKMASIIADRASMERYYGVVLIPEGIIEFIPEINRLVKEIEALSNRSQSLSLTSLSQESQDLLATFPESIVHQLLYDRDAHGNVYVSKISVDKLLIYLVDQHLRTHFKNVPFNAISHFLGYEGRSGLPTNFDNAYGYHLGYGAGVLSYNQCNGYLPAIEDLTQPLDQWRLRAIPVVKMCSTRERNDQVQPIITKTLVDINSPAFRKFKLYRKIWTLEDSYRFLGPLQLHTPKGTPSDHFPPLVLLLNHSDWEKRSAFCMEIPDMTY